MRDTILLLVKLKSENNSFKKIGLMLKSEILQKLSNKHNNLRAEDIEILFNIPNYFITFMWLT